eukprot:scaffold2845_cov50-Cylindrotheca_fusiformis.AAC.4
MLSVVDCRDTLDVLIEEAKQSRPTLEHSLTKFHTTYIGAQSDQIPRESHRTLEREDLALEVKWHCSTKPFITVVSMLTITRHIDQNSPEDHHHGAPEWTEASESGDLQRLVPVDEPKTHGVLSSIVWQKQAGRVVFVERRVGVSCSPSSDVVSS